MNPGVVSSGAGGHLWARPRTAGTRDEAPVDQFSTNVVVPSLSLDPRELAKVTGAALYEERQLHETLADQVVFVSSAPVHPSIAEYYLQYLPERSWSDRQVHFVSVGDQSPTPLSQKLLSSRATMEKVREAMGPYSRMTCFVSSLAEKQVATELGIPLYATDPSLLEWGTKSGSRQTFAECGVPHPDGTPLVRSAQELAAQIDLVMERNPTARKMVVKLNEGFSGEGNAILKLPETAPGTPREGRLDAIEDALHHMRYQAPNESWNTFSGRFEDLGVLAECFVEGATSSPSAQAKILPDGTVEVVSTHEQVLGGPDGQVYLGSRFPAAPEYRAELMEHCRKIGENLSAKGCRERFAVDFMAVPGGGVQAIEINLRKGGTTHPWETLQQLTRGHTEGSGTFLTDSGRVRAYRASDNEKQPQFQGFLPGDVLDVAARHGLHYTGREEEGTTFHLLGALREYGKFGMTCIAATPERAEQLYERTRETLERVLSPGSYSLDAPSHRLTEAPEGTGTTSGALVLNQREHKLDTPWLRTTAFQGRRMAAAVNLRGQHGVRIFNLETGQLQEEVPGHKTPVRALALTGHQLASGSADGEVRLQRKEGATQSFQVDGLVNALAFSPDEKELAVGSSDHALHIFDLKSGQQRKLEGHGHWVRAVAYRGREVLSGSQDGTVRLWDARGKTRRILDCGAGVLSLSVSPDQSQVAVATADRRLSMWSLETGEPLWQRQLGWQPEDVRFAPDGRNLIFRSSSGGVQLASAGEGAPGLELPLDFAVGAVAARKTDMGLELTAASGAGELRRWSVLPGA